MKQILTKLSVLRHLIRLARDTSKTEEVFAMVDELNRIEGLTQRFPFTPEMQTYLEAPFTQGFPDLEALRAMPEDTLGHALAVHMDHLGVDFSEFDRKPEAQTDIDHIDRHVYETHDIWHALTGFGTGPANEIGLQGFTLAQMRGVPSLSLVALAISRIFVAGQPELAPIFDAIALGWTRGRSAKALFGVDWRPYFARPIAEVRAEFGILPVESEALDEVSEALAA